MMINYFSEHPTLLFIGNCCLAPAFFIFIGYMIRVYRPRLRMPFTLRDDESEEFQDKF